MNDRCAAARISFFCELNDEGTSYLGHAVPLRGQGGYARRAVFLTTEALPMPEETKQLSELGTCVSYFPDLFLGALVLRVPRSSLALAGAGTAPFTTISSALISLP